MLKDLYGLRIKRIVYTLRENYLFDPQSVSIDLHGPENSSFLIGTGSVIQCRAGRRVPGALMHPRVTD